MKTWFAQYSDGPAEDFLEATVLASEKKITIGIRRNNINETFHWDMNEVEAVFLQSQQSTQICHAGSRGKLLIEGKDAFAFVENVKAEARKPWYKTGKAKEWSRALGLVSGICGVLVIIYLLVVPWLAQRMAVTVSTDTEAKFGDAIYSGLALAAKEDQQASLLLNEFFNELNIKTKYKIRITVVKDEIVNAFALPGGRIVVYSALLSRIETYPELAALLSHEFTHVNNQHSTRSVFRMLGSRIFLGLLFGRFGSVTSVMIDQADRLKSLTYSRSLEKEADLEGLHLLKERKITPEGFVNLFHHLKAAESSGNTPEFLNSHPDINKRIEYVKEASAGARGEENNQLKSIFDELKSLQP